MGIKCDVEPDNSKLFRVQNLNHLHICQHVAEFNCYSMVYKLEKLEDYHLDWDGEDSKKKEEAKLKHEEQEKQKLEKKMQEMLDKTEQENSTEESLQVKELEK